MSNPVVLASIVVLAVLSAGPLELEDSCSIPDPKVAPDVPFLALELSGAARRPDFGIGKLGIGARQSAIRVAATEGKFRGWFGSKPSPAVDFSRQRVVVYTFVTSTRQVHFVSAVRDDGRRLHLVVNHPVQCLGDAAEQLETRSLAVAVPRTDRKIVVDTCTTYAPDCKRQFP